MRVILEVVAGPHVGQKITLRGGQVATMGRTEWADFAFPSDGRMSSTHFSLECGEDLCRLRDLHSTNGTMVNGQQATEATVGNGDEIRAGQTLFAVHIKGAPPTVPPVEPASLAATRPEPAAPTQRPSSDPPDETGTPVELPAGYERMLRDDDSRVRSRTFWAAAWSGQKWLLDYSRDLCDRPSLEHWDAILLVAILGGADDLVRILAVGRAEQLGPHRFQALGTFGHPAGIESLLEAIGSDDPAAAVAAAEAFKKITGAEIDSDRRVKLPQDHRSPPEEPRQELVEEVPLPSLQRARQHWNEVKHLLADGTRYACGLDLSGEVSEETLLQLDADSRREAHLRALFQEG